MLIFGMWEVDLCMNYVMRGPHSCVISLSLTLYHHST